MLDVDAHRSFSPGGAGGSEGQAREGVDDLVHRLLEGRVTEGSGHFPASAGALRFCGGDRSVPVGVSQEADEAADEESEFGIPAEKGLPEAVTLGRPASAGRRPG
ncbi:MAG TPA: hypothetical protein VJ622_18840, partial [Acidimicrobiia bacterium]|nr:hypothetical protein [Acidimicrobiia bacterium]